MYMSYINAAAQLWLFYIYISFVFFFKSWIENGFGQADMETQWKRKRDSQNIETHQICINVISIKWNNTTMDEIAFRARARVRILKMHVLVGMRIWIYYGTASEPRRAQTSQIDWQIRCRMKPFRARFLWQCDRHRKLCGSAKPMAVHFISIPFYYLPILNACNSLWDIDISVELTEITFLFESSSIDFIPNSIVSDSEVRKQQQQQKPAPIFVSYLCWSTKTTSCCLQGKCRRQLKNSWHRFICATRKNQFFLLSKIRCAEQKEKNQQHVFSCSLNTDCRLFTLALWG